MLNRVESHLGGKEAAVAPQRMELFSLLAKEAADWAVFAVDPKGHVTNWSAGAQQMTGYHADEIVGKHFSVLFGPEDLRQRKPAQELQNAATWGRWESRGRAVRKDASVFLARVATICLRDSSGGLRGFARVMHDLTRGEAADAGLQLFTDFWEQLPQGMLILHADRSSAGETLRVLAANAAALGVLGQQGLVVEDLLGKTWEEVVEGCAGLPQLDFSKALWSVVGSQAKNKLGEFRRQDGASQQVFAISAFSLAHQCIGLLFENITHFRRKGDDLSGFGVG